MNRPLRSRKTVTASSSPSPSPTHAGGVSLSELKRYADGWVLDCKYHQLSVQTIYGRKTILEKLIWFLTEKQCATCGTPELKAFLA